MDASGTIASSGAYRTENSGHAGEENLFGREHVGNKAEGQNRKRRLSLALKISLAVGCGRSG
jgi:hypothetical protein